MSRIIYDTLTLSKTRLGEPYVQQTIFTHIPKIEYEPNDNRESKYNIVSTHWVTPSSNTEDDDARILHRVSVETSNNKGQYDETARQAGPKVHMLMSKTSRFLESNKEYLASQIINEHQDNTETPYADAWEDATFGRYSLDPRNQGGVNVSLSHVKPTIVFSLTGTQFHTGLHNTEVGGIITDVQEDAKTGARRHRVIRIFPKEGE